MLPAHTDLLNKESAVKSSPSLEGHPLSILTADMSKAAGPGDCLTKADFRNPGYQKKQGLTCSLISASWLYPLHVGKTSLRRCDVVKQGVSKSA